MLAFLLTTKEYQTDHIGADRNSSLQALSIWEKHDETAPGVLWFAAVGHLGPMGTGAI